VDRHNDSPYPQALPAVGREVDELMRAILADIDILSIIQRGVQTSPGTKNSPVVKGFDYGKG
jgi:hypothetical protein